MIIDGAICKLKAGIIEVEAPAGFTILTKRKIAAAMRYKVKKDKRFKPDYQFKGMIIDLLFSIRPIPTLRDAVAGS